MKIIKNKFWLFLICMVCITSVHVPTHAMQSTVSSNDNKLTWVAAGVIGVTAFISLGCYLKVRVDEKVRAGENEIKALEKKLNNSRGDMFHRSYPESWISQIREQDRKIKEDSLLMSFIGEKWQLKKKFFVREMLREAKSVKSKLNGDREKIFTQLMAENFVIDEKYLKNTTFTSSEEEHLSRCMCTLGTYKYLEKGEVAEFEQWSFPKVIVPGNEVTLEEILAIIGRWKDFSPFYRDNIGWGYTQRIRDQAAEDKRTQETVMFLNWYKTKSKPTHRAILFGDQQIWIETALPEKIVKYARQNFSHFSKK